MKTLCLAMDYGDAGWLKNRVEAARPGEEVVVVAPNFAGHVAAQEAGIACDSARAEAYGLDRQGLSDRARQLALRWADQPGVGDVLARAGVDRFGPYPLPPMLYVSISALLYEVLQAWDFAAALLDRYSPDRVVLGGRRDPVATPRLFVLTAGNGLDREAVEVMCRERGIPTVRHGPAPRSPLVKRACRNVLRAARGVLPARADAPWTPPSMPWPKEGGPKILAYTWPGYYLEQIAPALEALAADGARPLVVFCGGEPSAERVRALNQAGCMTLHRKEWPVPRNARAKRYAAAGQRAARALRNSDALAAFFSDSHGSYYRGVAYAVIRRELTVNLPGAVSSLAVGEELLDWFEPDLVFGHFAVHALEICDVLPARARGIPTLTCPHGFFNCYATERKPYAAEHYAAHGAMMREALGESLRTDTGKVHTVGELRVVGGAGERLSRREAKARYGFDPDRPLAVFCDSSGYALTAEWRHAGWETVQRIVELRAAMPELQIVFRVHGGPDYTGMRRWFDDQQGVTFQQAPEPLLTDMVQAADVVLSHHSSAIPEALLMGRQVIYLCALSDKEPAYFTGGGAPLVCDDFARLPGMVREVVRAAHGPDEVLRLAQPYFDATLAGNDGGAKSRMVALLRRLATTPEESRGPGFDDWLARVKASAEFPCARWDEWATAIASGKPFGNKP